MKTLRLLICLSLLLPASVAAQQLQRVTITLKNNGLLPKHVKFLEKRAGEPFNVFTTYLAPGQTYKVELVPGTLLSQVNQEEINASMRGLDVPGKPLLVVKPEDAGKTVNLIAKKEPINGTERPRL
ncbi:hypothetical protein [Fibrella arboris]|uniref:hypothetical protein n=1 Tax=Fibrella arboris TaxID=3242486 RepID=UPI0035222C70